MADSVAIVVQSGDMDNLYSALIIGNGASWEHLFTDFRALGGRILPVR